MHTYKLNKVLDFKIMGQRGYDQTACLADYAQDVAEDHSHGQCTRRHLIEKAKRIAKNDENLKDSKTKMLQMRWKFYKSKSMIYNEFINKNQWIWILNAKDMDKTNQFGWKGWN